jgi:hypothetical protein
MHERGQETGEWFSAGGWGGGGGGSERSSNVCCSLILLQIYVEYASGKLIFMHVEYALAN